MDALTRETVLPPEARLDLGPPRLSAPASPLRGDRPERWGWRRAPIFGGAVALTAFGLRQIYAVVSVGSITTLEWLLLVLFTALFAWVAFAFMSALAGFFVTLAGARAGLDIPTTDPPPALSARTAMLLPTYNEDPQAVTARLRAMWESVERTGQGAQFDWHLLSDTTDPDIWIAEEAAFRALRYACEGRFYYRRRAQNHARKAGNIGDWVARFGARYDHMIVLDADSLMEGDTLVRLAHAMETRPEAGLIQTAPVLVNARTLFARMQQFAGRLYGPMVIAGSAWWQGPDGNYWGHNAIIRVAAFAAHASLPNLRGRKPFGGHILSHDFIEAAFLRRAGYAVYAAPALGGSYEEGPPSLIDFAVRDRRWCQGNLQHLGVLPARGLRWLSRLHLLVGVGAYVTAPLWFAFLALGLLISLQAAFVRPEYFAKGFNLFPAWPQQDPVLAARLFALTMGLLLAPKLMAFLTLAVRGAERRAFGGFFRSLAGLVGETLLAILIAPAMMVFQSLAVTQILLGQDAGWHVQRRDDGAVPRAEVARKLMAPTLVGLAMSLAAYSISVPLLLWMSPVALGLLLAVPVGLATSRRLARPGALATPEDLAPPAVVSRAGELMAAGRHEAAPALQRLRGDADLRDLHLAQLSPAPLVRGGPVDLALATARVKVGACETLAELEAWLDARETRALLGDPALLLQALALS